MESVRDDDDWFLFSGLSDENPQEISNGTDVNPREICNECQRPTKTCWCSSLPNPPIGLSSRVDKVIIFQHPKEVKRPHQTAKIAVKSIGEGKCQIHTRSKIKADDPVLLEATSRSGSSVYLMYPNRNSVDVKTLKSQHKSSTIILLDGTWHEAKKLLERSPSLAKLPSLHLDLHSGTGEEEVSSSWVKSAFIIKTQPDPKCMSTVETVAHTLALIEEDQSIVERMLRPLNTICEIQMNHGAVIHDDKVTKKQKCLENSDCRQCRQCRQPKQ